MYIPVHGSYFELSGREQLQEHQKSHPKEIKLSYRSCIISKPYPVEKAVKINMNTVTVGGIKQNILTMTITKAKNIAHHRHNGSGMCVR